MAIRSRHLSPAAQDARERALEALSHMRRDKGLSLTRAAKRVGTKLETVKKYAGSALRRRSSGAWRATKADRMLRTMIFPTPSGPIGLELRDSRTASLLGEYWTAVDRYNTTGDAAALLPFEGKSITVKGIKHPFVTDRRILRRLSLAGVIEFEDIYARTQ